MSEIKIKEYLKLLSEAEKKFKNEVYQKETILKNLKENQSRLAKWQQVEDANKSHIQNDEALFNYIKSRFDDGTLKGIINLAMPLIKENLYKAIENQLAFLTTPKTN